MLNRVSDYLRFKFAVMRESGLAFAFLLIAIAAVVLGVFARPDYGQEPREGTPVAETITRIITPSSRYGAYNRIVTLQDYSGNEQYVTVPVDMIMGCKVGDRVTALRSAVSLSLPPVPCKHTKPTYGK